MGVGGEGRGEGEGFHSNQQQAYNLLHWCLSYQWFLCTWTYPFTHWLATSYSAVPPHLGILVLVFLAVAEEDADEPQQDQLHLVLCGPLSEALDILRRGGEEGREGEGMTRGTDHRGALRHSQYAELHPLHMTVAGVREVSNLYLIFCNELIDGVDETGLTGEAKFTALKHFCSTSARTLLSRPLRSRWVQSASTTFTDRGRHNTE